MTNFQKCVINQKSEKTFPRYMYLDGFWQIFGNFIQKYFLTLVKNNVGKKSLFGDFLEIRFFVCFCFVFFFFVFFCQKSDYLNRFLVNFPF